MITLHKAPQLSLFVILLGLSMTLFASGDPQKRGQEQETGAQSPTLTQTIRCSVEHLIGCTQEKPQCTDGDAVLAEVSGGSPTFYELDLLNRVAKLRGKDEKGVVVRIHRIGFTPDFDFVNVQGINEGWMPWTLSYRVSDGKGFVSETAPGFVSLYQVACAISKQGLDHDVGQ